MKPGIKEKMKLDEIVQAETEVATIGVCVAITRPVPTSELGSASCVDSARLPDTRLVR